MSHYSSKHGINFQNWREMEREENESSQRRLFGSAISQVQMQQEPNPAGGKSVQVPAKKSRRSVFDRMDFNGTPFLQATTLSPPFTEDRQRQRYGLRKDSRFAESIGGRAPRRSWHGDDGGDRFYDDYRIGRREASDMDRESYGVPTSRRVVQRNGPYGRPSSMRGGGSESNPGRAVYRLSDEGREVGDHGNRRVVSYGGTGPEIFSGFSRRWNHDMYEGPMSAPQSRVFVRNLPKMVTNDALQALFGKAGDVVMVNIDKGPLTTATIGFLRRETGIIAQEKFNGTMFKGSRIKVAEIPESEPGRQDGEENNTEAEPGDDVVMSVAKDEEMNRRQVSVVYSDKRSGRGYRGGASNRTFLPNDEPRKSVFRRLDD